MIITEQYSTISFNCSKKEFTMNVNEIKEQICDVCHKMWQLGWVAANDGNVSVKLDDGTFIATPQVSARVLSRPIFSSGSMTRARFSKLLKAGSPPPRSKCTSDATANVPM